MRKDLPPVTVRMSGNLYHLDEVMKYIKRNNLYQASMYLVNNTGMGKDYATKLAMAIRDAWQAGYNPIRLSCSLVGTSRATARFTVRIDEVALNEEKRKKEEEELAAKEAKEKAEKQAAFDAMSPEMKLLLRIRKANEVILDEDVTESLDCIDRMVVKILARIEQKPEAKRTIEDFYTQYLPRTVEIAEKYAKIYLTGIDNEDTAALKADLMKALDTCDDAFHNLYERTYDEDMIALQSEIAALHSRLSYDGLTKSDFDISE